MKPAADRETHHVVKGVSLVYPGLISRRGAWMTSSHILHHPLPAQRDKHNPSLSIFELLINDAHRGGRAVCVQCYV
ncbi:hypothetical protein OYC64_007833 [Pagothenia borchgrevinki]|uniref:Uncharacterized protein n=1 Tax=Pagothenia borchgrevinki TaxID=8213 RepID=A0ABD2GTK7_PAGBO